MTASTRLVAIEISIRQGADRLARELEDRALAAVPGLDEDAVTA